MPRWLNMAKCLGLIACLVRPTCYAADSTPAPIRIVASTYEPYRISETTGIINELVLAACHAAKLPIAKIEMLPSERARLTFENDVNVIYLETNSYVDTTKNPLYAIAKQWPFKVLVYYDKSRFSDGAPKQVADFAGKTMGYYRADIATKEYFSSHGAIMSPRDEQRQLYVMLLNRRIDSLISVEDNALIELDRLDPGWRDRIGSFGPYYSGWGGPVYHSDNPAVLQFIAHYLDGYHHIQADGTMRAILEHYYGKDHVPATFFQ